MYTVNSLSGGKTSSYMAMHYEADYNVFALVCIDDPKCRPSDKKLVQRVNDKLEQSQGGKYGEFIATAEDDQVLRVMFDLEQLMGQEITWVRGVSFEQLISKKKMLPNMNMRYCTTELKIIPMCEWVVRNLLGDDQQPVFTNQGIRFDEENRAKKGLCREYRNKIIVGKRGSRNKWHEFFWAVANYPLIIDRVIHYQIQSFWADKGIVFPNYSN